ncbi:MAG: hypothetical protein QOC73_499, partial [Actinomycetota bacterium]|nr:hypothetical protein [Actinomycetota bacterium]
ELQRLLEDLDERRQASDEDDAG